MNFKHFQLNDDGYSILILFISSKCPSRKEIFAKAYLLVNLEAMIGIDDYCRLAGISHMRQMVNSYLFGEGLMVHFASNSATDWLSNNTIIF